MAKPRLRATLTFFCITLLIPTLLIGLAEICMRIFWQRLDPLAVFVTSPQLRMDTQGAATSGMFEFDPLLTWRLRPNLRNVWWDYTSVTTNTAHLRMEREISAKHGLRIVTLGDSVTFGYRVPAAMSKDKPGEFDAEEKSYPCLLEEMLRKKFPGREIEVIPLACPGYSSAQGLAWLRREIAELQPDIVTACFGWNDVRAAGAADRDTMPGTSTQVRIRALMSRSQLLLHIAQGAQSKTAAVIPKAEPRSSPEEYTAHFAEMHALCAEHGAWFGIILPIYRDPNKPGDYPEEQNITGNPAEGERMTQYRNQLRTVAAAQKIPALEIPELTEQAWPANTELFGERIHPNSPGHALIVQRLLEFIGPAVSERVR